MRRCASRWHGCDSLVNEDEEALRRGGPHVLEVLIHHRRALDVHQPPIVLGGFEKVRDVLVRVEIRVRRVGAGLGVTARVRGHGHAWVGSHGERMTK